MKLIAVIFLIVLLAAHLAGDPAELAARPLSMFRDDHLRYFGYALFALLLTVAALMTATALRKRRLEHAGVFVLAAFLLAVVALTPSADGLHLACSLVLLALLFGYFAAVLRAAGGWYFWPHLGVPVLLVALTRCHSYGLWQKSLIVYFLLAAAVHHHLLARRPAAELGTGTRRRPAWLPPRKVVYSVSPGKAWARKR